MAAQLECGLELQILALECLHENVDTILYERDLSRLLFKFLESSSVLDEILDELELPLEAFWNQLALVLDIGLHLVVD